MVKKRVGIIDVPPGVIITKHEKIAADFLASKLSCDVTFLKPNRHKGSKTPDIEMLDLFWEIKSPKGKSSRTIENNLRLALQQSCNIVLDLRRMDGRIPTNKLLNEIERQFNSSKSIRRLIVVTKQNVYIDHKRS